MEREVRTFYVGWLAPEPNGAHWVHNQVGVSAIAAAWAPSIASTRPPYARHSQGNQPRHQVLGDIGERHGVQDFRLTLITVSAARITVCGTVYLPVEDRFPGLCALESVAL